MRRMCWQKSTWGSRGNRSCWVLAAIGTNLILNGFSGVCAMRCGDIRADYRLTDLARGNCFVQKCPNWIACLTLGSQVLVKHRFINLHLRYPSPLRPLCNNRNLNLRFLFFNLFLTTRTILLLLLPLSPQIRTKEFLWRCRFPGNHCQSYSYDSLRA